MDDDAPLLTTLDLLTLLIRICITHESHHCRICKRCLCIDVGVPLWVSRFYCSWNHRRRCVQKLLIQRTEVKWKCRVRTRKVRKCPVSENTAEKVKSSTNIHMDAWMTPGTRLPGRRELPQLAEIVVQVRFRQTGCTCHG